MKITPTELKQIIKEEALRMKKKMTLEAEKKSIIKKLQEMEECDMMEDAPIEEGWPFTKKDPAAEKQKAISAINGHPAYKKTAPFVAQKNGLDVNMVFEKLVEFVVANGGVFPAGGIAWDNAKQEFVDKTKYTGTAPGMQGAAE